MRPAEKENASAILAFAGVDSGYQGTTVLREVSFEVHPGEVVALLGPNGAGKTTVLRTAAGALRPSRGHVFLGGVEVTGYPPHRRAAAGLCLIPDGRGVFRGLTVRENLCMMAGRTQRVDEAVDKALAVFPVLKPRLSELAGRLSGGQQQMLALARAYVTEPSVILLDEVSMGLAPQVVDQIFEVLADLAAKGVAMIVVEQYVTRAMEIADTVLLLRKGTLTYDGPPGGLNEEDVLHDYLGVDFSAGADAR